MSTLKYLLWTVGIFCLTGHVSAQWSSNPTMNTAICTITRNQQNSRVTTDGYGGAIIVWLDQRSGSSSYLYAQRVNAAGYLSWSTGGRLVAPYNCSNPGIISDGSGGAIISWSDTRSGQWRVYAQKITGGGTLGWISTGVALGGGGTQTVPSIASDGSGGAIIAWADNVGGNTDIMAQHISFLGERKWNGPYAVRVCNAAGSQDYPVAAVDGSGGVIIAWQDGRNGSSNLDIYSQRVNAAGIPLWTANGLPVAAEIGNQSAPVIDAIGGGGAVMIWTDQRNPSNQTIFAQRLAPTGAPLWTTNGVLVSDQPHALDPQIMSDGGGGAYAVWRDYRIMGYPGGLSSIWLQHIDAGGTAVWAPEGVSPCKSADQSGARLTSDGTGGVIVSWHEVAPRVHIFAQRLSAEGERLWGDRTYVSYAPGDQTYPAPVSDGTGGVIIAWTDSRQGYSNYDIYAQRVLNNGLRDGPKGDITGTVSSMGEGLGPLVVALVSTTGNKIIWVPPTTSDAEGHYVIPNVPPGYWQVAIFEPLGYDADVNPQPIMLPPGQTVAVDFTLAQTVAENASRIKAYWEHQFGVYVNHLGVAQESEEQLNGYIREVAEHYTPHFSVFKFMYSFEQWLDVLQVEEDPPLVDLARAQVAALVLNLASLRVGQYTAVARDGRTSGDVLTYVSTLLASEHSSDLSHAMVYASHVNNRVTIRAGAIPEGTILYRKGLETTNGAREIPGSFALRDNYPNPFNPGTTIEYDLPRDAAVTVRVYGALGQEVASLVNQKMPAGVHRVHFDGSSLPSGVYLCRLQADDFIATKRLILVK